MTANRMVSPFSSTTRLIFHRFSTVVSPLVISISLQRRTERGASACPITDAPSWKTNCENVSCFCLLITNPSKRPLLRTEGVLDTPHSTCPSCQDKSRKERTHSGRVSATISTAFSHPPFHTLNTSPSSWPRIQSVSLEPSPCHSMPSAWLKMMSMQCDKRRAPRFFGGLRHTIV